MSLLGLAILSLVVSIIAGALGFSGLAAGASRVAGVLFAIFLTIAVVLFALVVLGVRMIT